MKLVRITCVRSYTAEGGIEEFAFENCDVNFDTRNGWINVSNDRRAIIAGFAPQTVLRFHVDNVPDAASNGAIITIDDSEGPRSTGKVVDIAARLVH